MLRTHFSSMPFPFASALLKTFSTIASSSPWGRPRRRSPASSRIADSSAARAADASAPAFENRRAARVCLLDQGVQGVSPPCSGQGHQMMSGVCARMSCLRRFQAHVSYAMVAFGRTQGLVEGGHLERGHRHHPRLGRSSSLRLTL